MKLFRYSLPLLIFGVIIIFLGLGLNLNPREVPSPLINKPAPAFLLPQLKDSAPSVGNDDLIGQVWFFNVWASWCAGCKVEHEALIAMAAQGANIIGLNYKDKQLSAKQWLRDYQNPYSMVLIDADGRNGIDWGVYGVPETFLIDKKGNIRIKHIGPINHDDAQRLLAHAAELQNET